MAFLARGVRSLLLPLVLIGCAGGEPEPEKPVDTGGARLVDGDGDGAPEGEDCNDANAAVYPGAIEVCDGVDNDCNGTIDGADAADAVPSYADADGDTFGDDGTAELGCDLPPGRAAVGGDCDDYDAELNPAAEEICDGLDNNCDGNADGEDAEGATLWYRDADRDEYGDDAVSWGGCEAPRGYVAEGGDCDDRNPSASPGVDEQCDAVDNNCDGAIDEAGASGEKRWYLDADGDGYGSTTSARACTLSPGYANNNDDCNDADAAVSPAATESCNGVDDDCDRRTDEAGSVGETIWYTDADGDGYGVATPTTSACAAPVGFTDNTADCDDTDAGVSPGAAERCDFGDVDDDCDGLADEADPDLVGSGTWYADADLDGFGDAGSPLSATCAPAGAVSDASDCDDADAAVHPGATEACEATADQNCDGLVGTTDHDGDGAVSCEDCDDTDAAEAPGAVERLDGDDDDCDGLVDEYVGDLSLSSAADIDTFCASYASVEGSLDLDHTPSLRALECLRAVSGDLRVSGVSAPDLHGLERLAWVGGTTFFGGDLGGAKWLEPSTFGSLLGLDRLSSVGGDFWVADNEVADLGGTPRLVEVGGGVVLYDLPLVDVSLPMTSLGVGLWLENLPYLASVEAPELTAMGGGLWFERVAATSGSFTVDWPVDIPGTLGLVELPTGANTGWTLPASVGALWVSQTDLADLGGLEVLGAVAGDAVVSDNPLLADLSALDGVVTIGGDLTLSNNPALVDWAGFSSLESVAGRVRLSGSGPTDASGFGALTAIGDGLSITGASSLTTISGFGALESCGDLEMYSLQRLAGADGLSGTAFTGEVSLTYLSALTDLALLAGTTDLAGSLVITDNRALASTDGLDALQSVGAAFTVMDNAALADLSAPALRSVAGALSLRDLDVLASLDLGALESVGGDVALEYLERLPDLSGLRSLRSVGGLWVSQLDLLADLSGLDALEAVEGSLILERNDDLTTLTGLGALQAVGTDLHVDGHPALLSLQGLDSLETVGRDLTLENNSALVRPDSLGALQSIGRDFWVESNAALEDFSGLGSPTLGSSLWVSACDSLTSMDGLEGVTAVSHHLVLYRLPSLADLGGLAGVQSVGADLRICDCDSLLDLTGLDSLESVGESLEIGYQVSWAWGEGNAALLSLDGLGSLQTVGDALVIQDHALLSDIDALDGLASVGGALYVVDNLSLLTSDANDLADGSPTVGGSVHISGNL